MTAITSIILSVLMGLSQNFAAYTGINNIQCNPAIIVSRIIEVAKKSLEIYFTVIVAEDAFDTVRSYFSDSEDTAQKVSEEQQSAKKKSCNKECRQRVENWRKGFQPDNDTKQDDNKTSQKRKQRKMNKKNRRRQIAQIPMSERDNHDDRIRVAVMGEEDYLILY